jgi:hypothetical protein
MKIVVEQGSGSGKLIKAIKKIRNQPDQKIPLRNFVGILPRKEDPMEFQKRLRDER